MSQTALGPANGRRLSRSNSTSSSVATVQKIDPVALKAGKRNSYLARPSSSDSPVSQIYVLDHATGDMRGGYSDMKDLTSNVKVHRLSQSSTANAVSKDNNHPRSTTRVETSSRNPKLDSMTNGSGDTKPHYSGPRPYERSRSGSSPKKNSNYTRAARPTSPVAASKIFYDNQESQTPLYNQETSSDRTQGSTRNIEDYFGEVWDNSNQGNGLGQTVDRNLLPNKSENSRQRSANDSRPDGNHHSTSANHVSAQKKPSHKTYRERTANGSKDTAGSSMSSTRSDGRRSHRSKVQKDMLSKALLKANQAVLLDNAQNIPGAIESYIEACDLLQEVMVQSQDPEDRKKLSTIRLTYSNRIAELHDLDDTFEHLMEKDPSEQTWTQNAENQDQSYHNEFENQAFSAKELNSNFLQRPESSHPQMYGGKAFIDHTPAAPKTVKASTSRSNQNAQVESHHIPSPLGSHLGQSSHADVTSTPGATLQSSGTVARHADFLPASESTSWLDTLDESASSHASSPLSSFDFGPRDGQLVSEIEAEFDALNRAVESAYDEETGQETTPKPHEHSVVSPTKTKLAPSVHDITTVPKALPLSSTGSEKKFDYLTHEYLDSEAEEEEELLEMMMAEGYSLGISHDKNTKSALPRQSDSSGISGRSSSRTWDSLATSTTATSGTTLSTLAETPELGLPQLPGHEIQQKSTVSSENQSPSRKSPPQPSSESIDKYIGIRDRRLSGQSAQQLKIETYNRRTSISKPLPSHPGVPVAHEAPYNAPSDVERALPLVPPPAVSGESLSGESLSSGVHPGGLPMSLDDNVLVPPSPRRVAKMMPPPPRKNMSESSIKSRKLSVTTTELNNLNPTTQSAAGFPEAKRTVSLSNLGASNASPNLVTAVSTGGMYLFDQIPSPVILTVAQSPTMGPNPLPLEPCPESFLLRPFWLMRCLYQVLAHPKGGYLTSKLFVPRDIWRVKNVKLKCVDDKISQCDLLTAALLKLAKVDTLDADAVLEELQSFETILDQTRQSLQKKLGNDVGLSGSANAFKNSPAGEEPELFPVKSANTSAAKSFASSWRKLRSKSSTAALNSSAMSKDALSGLSTPSIPMTDSHSVATSRSYRNQRNPPPTPTAMPHIPQQHAAYMSSMARLFDSVQVLDAIARQVEDPGLKATSQTLVGLEFSMRNAAEFFAFYIIRFVLADIGMLIDKFLKRATEWVMN